MRNPRAVHPSIVCELLHPCRSGGNFALFPTLGFGRSERRACWWQGDAANGKGFIGSVKRDIHGPEAQNVLWIVFQLRCVCGRAQKLRDAVFTIMIALARGSYVDPGLGRGILVCIFTRKLMINSYAAMRGT